MTPRKKPLTDAQLEAIIVDWGTLQASIMALDEASLERAIKLERNGKDRFRIIMRLHQRFTRLRAERERRELLGT